MPFVPSFLSPTKRQPDECTFGGDRGKGSLREAVGNRSPLIKSARAAEQHEAKDFLHFTASYTHYIKVTIYNCRWYVVVRREVFERTYFLPDATMAYNGFIGCDNQRISYGIGPYLGLSNRYDCHKS